jgi:hypothetical protein
MEGLKQQVQGPEFKPQCCQKKRRKEKIIFKGKIV